jgi:hypothetical protein
MSSDNMPTPNWMRGTCDDCGGPCSRRAVRCRRCHYRRVHTAAQARLRRCRRCRQRKLTARSGARVCRSCYLAGAWNQEKMAAAIRAVGVNGHGPSYGEFPHTARAVQLFGSWNEALRAAGYEPPKTWGAAAVPRQPVRE